MTPQIAKSTQSPVQPHASAAPATPSAIVALPVDVYDGADELLIVADLPGVEANAVDVHVEGNQLSIEGRQSDVGIDAIARHYVRRFTLPDTVDKNQVAAQFEAGVLQLRLQKTPQSKPRQIPVN
jgi:HSP20 family molecular chaperone IbpA